MDRRLGDILAKCMAAAPTRTDEEWAAVEEQRAREEMRQRQAEERLARETRAARLRDSGVCLEAGDVPAVVADALEETRAVSVVSEWMGLVAKQEARRILILCGGVGIGKTVAASLAIAKWGGHCIRAPQLAQRIDPWRSDADAGHELVALGAYFLLLDDLGRDPEVEATPRWREAFGRFVDERQMHGYTIITSNLPRSKFRERYDERTISRLNQCAKAVEMAGKDLRRDGGGL